MAPCGRPSPLPCGRARTGAREEGTPDTVSWVAGGPQSGGARGHAPARAPVRGGWSGGKTPGRAREPAAGMARRWLPVYAWAAGSGCSGGTAYTPRSAASAAATISGANGSPERCLCRSHSR